MFVFRQPHRLGGGVRMGSSNSGTVLDNSQIFTNQPGNWRLHATDVDRQVILNAVNQSVDILTLNLSISSRPCLSHTNIFKNKRDRAMITI